MTPLSEVRAALEEIRENCIGDPTKGNADLRRLTADALTHLAEVEAELQQARPMTTEEREAVAQYIKSKSTRIPLDANEQIARLRSDYDALLDHNGSQEQEIERLRAKLKYPDSLSGGEYERLVSWMNDPNRQPAHIAFTASACRDAALAFEESRRAALQSPGTTP